MSIFRISPTSSSSFFQVWSFSSKTVHEFLSSPIWATYLAQYNMILLPPKKTECPYLWQRSLLLKHKNSTFCVYLIHYLLSEERMKLFFCSLLPWYPKGITLFKSSLALSIYPSNTGNTKTNISIEQWWKVTDRGKSKYWEKNLLQCHTLLKMS